MSESRLGSGFTETIPPQEELSQYSAIVLQPSNVAIYTALSFRCNGTLVSLTIPSQVRGSDYSPVDYTLEPLPSIWRLDGTGYKRISVSTRRHEVPAAPRELRNGEVLSVKIDRIEHLPPLYKLGPTPGSFTPIVIANFAPTSNATQSKC